MDRVEQWLRQQGVGRHPVAERVAELLENIRQGAQRREDESWDQANERHAEEFIAWLKERFPGRVLEVSRPPADAHQRELVGRILGQASGREGQGFSPGPALTPEAFPPAVLVERQKLRPMARRTTSFNYIFTVPGQRPERLILVAHYDTWRGPGADDNTTGEEITKQYLLDDLRATQPPPLTHTYLLAGSEECGLIGFTSQVLLALGLGLANLALTKSLYAVTALGIALTPLAKFRFGVSGSREYVRSLSPEEIGEIQSVVSVDSVGEGKLYIPETSLGADFVRAFIPFEGYEALNDVLEEAAHLNGISYNTFIAGGTTDHISFLEVNSTLRDHLGDWLGCPRWLGAHKHGKRKVPAAALVSLCPGKASPLVFGGKIHTPNDTPDRVYPGPLGEALRVLDYWFHMIQGGARMAEPREPDEYHYAQLFRVHPGGDLNSAARAADTSGKAEYWLAMKDAVEPNRRNINGLYRVDAEIEGDRAICRNLRILDWGVHTRLHHEVTQRLEEAGGSFDRARLRTLEVHAPSGVLHFRARPKGAWAALEAAYRQALGSFDRFLGSNTFLSFFAAAYLLAKGVDLGLTFAFRSSYAFQQWFFDWFTLTLPVTVFAQLAVVLWLIGKKIPTMIDNNYKHLNKSDNLRSLRRVPGLGGHVPLPPLEVPPAAV